MSRVSRSSLVDVEVAVLHVTERAILVSPIGTSAERVWVAHCLCEWERHNDPNFATLTLPQWLAEEKDLV